MTPDKNKTYIISISGGKDSTALWLHLVKELKLPNVKIIFCDTGWEHPFTYEYVKYLHETLGEVITLKPELDFVELAIKKKRFPSARARFCTEHLKLKPTKQWLLSECASGNLDADNIVLCSGIRAEESPSRAKMDEYSESDDYYNLPHWRPIIAWTWQQVFDCHDRYGIKPNPLYAQGMGRVGCMPCIMNNKKELREIAIRFPEVFDKVRDAEIRFEKEYDKRPSSFWDYKTIPARFSSREWVHPDTGETFNIPTALDVKNYVLMNKEEKKFGGKMTELFEEEIPSCKSIYGLCE